MNRGESLAKNTVILAIGNVLPKAVSFITLPILTACLTKAEYGTYDLINTLVSLFLPLVTLQIQTAAFRFLIDKRSDTEGQRKIITNICVFTGVVSLFALLILYFVLWKNSIITRMLICLYFMLDIMIATSRQIIRGIGRNSVYSSSSIINSITNLLFVFLLVKTLSLGLNGVIASLSLALLASQVYILFKVNIIGYIDIKLIDSSTLAELLRYSWPMIPNSLSGWVMRLSDRLVITAFLGIEANAIYSVANKLPVLYSVVQNTFTIAWQENASIAANDKDSEMYYSHMFDVMYSIFFAIMAVLIASSPILFRVLIKGDYDAAYYQMPILYIGTFFNSLSAYMGGIYVAKKQTKQVGITTIFAAAFNLIIDLALVNKVGIYAGSISTLVSYCILTLYRMIDIQKIQRITFKIKKMVSLLAILIVMGALSYQRTVLCNILNVVLALVFAYATNHEVIKQISKAFLKIIRR